MLKNLLVNSIALQKLAKERVHSALHQSLAHLLNHRSFHALNHLRVVLHLWKSVLGEGVCLKLIEGIILLLLLSVENVGVLLAE